MVKGFALALVAVLCLAGQTPADDVVSTEPAAEETKIATILEGPLETAMLVDPAPSAAAERWWFSTDYLLAWIRGSLVQPLVTTSPSGTPMASAGVLGQNNTTILFGASRLNDDVRSGIKLGAGGWFDAARTWGVDVGFFVLESQNTLFFASSQGNPILARPFFNAVTSKQDSQLVAFPGFSTGSIVASIRSNNLYGGHVDFQEVFLEDTGYRLEAIVGYRYLRLDERLEVFQNVDFLGGGVIAAGTNIQTLDNFTVHNDLNAADLGVRAQLFGQRWSVDLLFKMAVGRMHRVTNITGLTQTTPPGGETITSPGGFLALESNSGQHNTNDWIVIPELGANFGWNITNNIRLCLGYDVFFWSNVARASDQVSLMINPNLFPPPKSTGLSGFPAFGVVRSDMWVQAINLGLEFRF